MAHNNRAPQTLMSVHLKHHVAKCIQTKKFYHEWTMANTTKNDQGFFLKIQDFFNYHLCLDKRRNH